MKRNIVCLVLLVYSAIAISQETISRTRRVRRGAYKGNRLKIPFSESTRDIQVITKEQIANIQCTL